MWAIEYFESNAPMMGEVDNPPSWDGVVAIIIVTLSLLYLLKKYKEYDENTPYFKTTIIAAIVPVVLIILLAISIDTSFINFFVPVAIIYLLFEIAILLQLIVNSLKRKKVLKIILICIGCILNTLLGIYCYICSYAYFFSASYPEPECSQLRMLRRLAYMEGGENGNSARMIPLSKAHLIYKNKEVIPDSIRKSATYGVYQYIFKPDTPKKGMYVIDAVPIEQKDKLPSFHLYPIDPEIPNVTYCISMAKRNGKPATENDRHFHKRNFLSVLLYSKVR